MGDPYVGGFSFGMIFALQNRRKPLHSKDLGQRRPAGLDVNPLIVRTYDQTTSYMTRFTQPFRFGPLPGGVSEF